MIGYLNNLLNSSAVYRPLLVTAWATPIISLLTAYLAICYYAGDLWPWLAIVHEAGDRSLIDTVLYYEHAAREMPLDLILGVAVGACVLFVFPAQSSEVSLEKAIRVRLLLAVSAMLFVVIICVGTLRTGGIEVLSNNLLQMHTRPGAPLNWGAHWRYHLLSRLVLMSVSLGFAGLLLLATKGRRSGGSKQALAIFRYALFLYFLLTLVFVPDLDSFVDAVFLGHEVRELFTHILTTVPLSWAVCLHLTRHDRRIQSGSAPIRHWPAAAGLTASVVGLYLLFAALGSSSVSQGQTDDPILLMCPHFFEHSFSYCMAPLVAGWTYQSAVLRNIQSRQACQGD